MTRHGNSHQRRYRSRREQSDAERPRGARGYGDGPGRGPALPDPHLLVNIEVEAGNTASEPNVYSNYLVYSTRRETEQDFYIRKREDVLRKGDGAWKIARRRIVLDQNALLAKNVNVFF